MNIKQAVAAGLVVVLAGCAAQNELRLPTVPVSSEYGLAEFSGVLDIVTVGDLACPMLEMPSGEVYGLLLPEGITARPGASIVLMTAEGEEIAGSGDLLTVGGGAFSFEFIDSYGFTDKWGDCPEVDGLIPVDPDSLTAA